MRVFVSIELIAEQGCRCQVALQKISCSVPQSGKGLHDAGSEVKMTRLVHRLHLPWLETTYSVSLACAAGVCSGSAKQEASA